MINTQKADTKRPAACGRVTIEQVEKELRETREEYEFRNPNSKRLFQAAQSSMPGGNTRTSLHFSPFPLYIDSGAGSVLTDVDEHDYVDCLGEFTAGLYGHGSEHVRKLVRQVSESGFSFGGPGESEIKYAELLCERFPGIESIRFCNSGTEASLYALTLARNHTGRTKFLSFSGGFHGGVLNFSSPNNPMNAPYDWLTSRYNDQEALQDVMTDYGDQLAAVIVEPMMSNGGCIPAERKFLVGLRDLCTKHGVLLIFDEVVTSRMSSGGMQKRLGILPDITTLGKYLGGGFSFGAFGGRKDVLAIMNPSRPGALNHPGTFNNNVYSMGVGYALLRDVFTEDRAEKLFADGEQVRSRINNTISAYTDKAQVTGVGSTMNIHFVGDEILSPEDVGHVDPRLFELFHLFLLNQGIYAARRGQITLSLPMAEREYVQIADGVEAFFERYKSLF